MNKTMHSSILTHNKITKRADFVIVLLGWWLTVRHHYCLWLDESNGGVCGGVRSGYSHNNNHHHSGRQCSLTTSP
jgi:hypothetical protein